MTRQANRSGSTRHRDKLLFTLAPIENSKKAVQLTESSQSCLGLTAVRRDSRFQPIPYEIFSVDTAVTLAAFPKDRDIPLRAKSVCLTERPASKYVRNARSADNRARYSGKQFFQHQPPPKIKTRHRTKVVVKQQNRKVVEKVPCVVSIQNLSIPMKYADPKRSTSKTLNNLCNANERIDNRTKSSNPPKQVGDNKRLCSTRGKETENKLLVQISEATQVSDFERILNSNAIQCERHGAVWHGCREHAPSASVAPRPRSAYSLHTVSETYYHLFKQHEDSLQPLIQTYRRAVADDHRDCPASLLQDNWYENLHDLSEFYEDDQALQREIETITDKIITEEVRTDKTPLTSRGKNFNVNLTDLIGLRVNGEGFSPVSNQDGPSSDVDRGDNETEDKEWLSAIMSANSDDPNSQDQAVDCLAQNLDSVNIDSDGKVPTITFSNCCEGRARSDQPNNTDVVIHLSVPRVDSVDEARPPM